MAGFQITGTVEGLADVIATLKALPDKLQRKVVRKALSKATKGTVAAAKRHCAVDSGTLKKSIGRKVVTYRESGSLVVIIGPRKGFGTMVHHAGARGELTYEDPVNIAHLVEFGTRPHSLEKGAKKQAVFRPSGKKKEHPGTKAKPFLRPAFDETKVQILDVFAAECQTGLEKELARVK